MPWRRLKQEGLENRVIFLWGGQVRSLLRWLFEQRWLREQATQLSVGRAFESKCTGPEVLCLVTLGQGKRTGHQAVKEDSGWQRSRRTLGTR